MKPEELYDLLHEEPFKPFHIVLSDGRLFDVRYPRINMVGVSYIIIGIPVADDPDPVFPIADHSVKVSLSLISRIEPLAETPAATPH